MKKLVIALFAVMALVGCSSAILEEEANLQGVSNIEYGQAAIIEEIDDKFRHVSEID